MYDVLLPQSTTEKHRVMHGVMEYHREYGMQYHKHLGPSKISIKHYGRVLTSPVEY